MSHLFWGCYRSEGDLSYQAVLVCFLAQRFELTFCFVPCTRVLQDFLRKKGHYGTVNMLLKESRMDSLDMAEVRLSL